MSEPSFYILITRKHVVIDYDTYRVRANRSEDEWFTIVDLKDPFEEQRARYRELCDLEYLIGIDSIAREVDVAKKIRNVLD